MIPLFNNTNPFFPNVIPAVNYYQPYNTAPTFNVLPSMLLISQQQQALKSQLLAMMQMRNQMVQANLKAQLQHTILEPKAEPSPSIISNSSESPVQNLAPATQETKDSELLSMEIPKFQLIKAQLKEMILFLLDNLGRADQAEIEKARRKYAQNLYLVPIFDILVIKYSPIKKHREDIIRYVIRKALKFVKKDTIEKNRVFGKRAYAMLCKKYFQINIDELGKQGVNIEDEKELIEFLLPYRKNSKNRTMNANFTAEIFSSKEFCQDYKRFLGTFDSMVEGDNSKKVQKLLVLAEECILKNCPEKIKKCTRLPWLQAWVEKSREVAFGLLNEDMLKEEKKVKIESSNYYSAFFVKEEENC